MVRHTGPGYGHFLLIPLLWLSLAACGGTAPDGASGKITPAVTRAAEKLEAGQPLDTHTARSDADGRLEVYVRVTSTAAENLDALAAHGLKDGRASSGMDVVQGWVNPHDLQALAALACVLRITLPQYALPR